MITLSLTAAQDLPCQLTAALAGRRLDLGGINPDDIYLYPALATGWAKVSEAATQLAHELTRLHAAAAPGHPYDEGDAPLALKALIYAATEVLNLYCKNLPKILPRARERPECQQIRAYHDSVNRLRNPIALMFNRMQNNYCEIITSQITSKVSGDTTFVYRLHIRGEVPPPDERVSRKEGFISFQRTLHDILHALLRTDAEAAALVRVLTDNAATPIKRKGIQALGLAPMLAFLRDRPPIVAYPEPTRFRGLVVTADTVVVDYVTATKLPDPVKRTLKAPQAEAPALTLGAV
jgi:hypothetical protein